MNNDALNQYLDPTTSSLIGQIGGGQMQQSQDALSQIRNFQPGQNASVQTEPKKKKGNVFTNLLPTVGGVLGGLATLPLNLAPGVGTAANIGAAAGGSALGKFLENKLEGNDLDEGVLGATAEGAIGQGVGGILGKVAAKGAGALGGAADRGATRLVQGQFNKGTMDTDTAQILRNMGVNNGAQVGDIAPVVTGGGGALSGGVRRGLTEANTGVDIMGIDDLARNALAEQGASARAIDTVNNNLTNSINNMVPGSVTKVPAKGGKSTFSYEPGSLSNALPENVFKQVQKIESLANEASNKAFDKAGTVVNTDEYAKYKAYQQISGELKNRAFGGDTPIPLSDVNRAQIIQELEPLKAVNPKAYNSYVEQIGKAANLQDLRPIQAPIVRANQALNATERVAQANAGMTPGDLFKQVSPVAGGMLAGPAGMAAGAVPALLTSKTASKVGSSTLGRISDFLTNPTVQKIVKESGPVAGQTVAHATNYLPEAAQQPITGANPMQQGVQQQGGVQPLPAENPLTQAILGAEQALQTGLGGAVDPYHAAAYSNYTNQGLDVLRQLAPALQKAQGAGAALQSAEEAFGQAGGGQGMLGGLLARLGGAVTGGPTATYSKQSEQLEKQLNALGIPSSYIPQITNTPEAAAQGFRTLEDIVSALGGGGVQTGAPVLAGVPAY